MSVDAGWLCLWVLPFCAGMPYNAEKNDSLVCFFRVPANQQLLTGRVPGNNELLTVTVTVNNELLIGTVPVKKELLTRTVPVNNFYLLNNRSFGSYVC